MSDLDLDKIESLAARARSPVFIGNGDPIVYLPGDTRIESVEKYLPNPTRVRRSLPVTTAESFNRYFNEFKLAHSRIYADLETVAVVAVIDDHDPHGFDGSVESADGDPIPEWCDHRVIYKCPYSRQWEAWAQMDRKKVDQVAFAEWLEDRVADVTQPIGTDLLDLCLQLRIHRKVAYGSAATLASGETSFSYSSENDSGTVAIPDVIKLGIPVFHSGTVYELTARFRYRLSEGNLLLWFELVEPAKYIEDAFAGVVAGIHEATGVEPLESKVPA